MPYLGRNNPMKKDIPAGLPPVSHEATARVRDRFPVPKECDSCGRKIEVLNNREIYGREFGDWPWVYACKPCDKYVGMHKFTHLPLGSPADRETRQLRSRGHEMHKLLMEKRSLSRRDAYRWIAEKLNIPTNRAHFGMFDAERCRTAIELIRKEIHDEH